jgi:hypothetical protein
MRYVLSAVLAVVLLLSASIVRPHERSLPNGDVSVEVVSAKGRTLLAIPHRDLRQGATRIIKQYLEAKKGERYGIIVRNRTAERVGIVVAVDGRNIISGKRSDLSAGEEMYLVNAFDEGRYDGWRTGADTVHRFYFTDPGDSYSSRTFNDASAMGVIAVAVFRERVRPEPPLGILEENRAPATPQSADGMERRKSLSPQEESAGTGFGEPQYSPVVRVAFEPESTPFRKTLIKYEWRNVLCRKGILRCGEETANRLWDDGEYAPFPPGSGER